MSYANANKTVKERGLRRATTAKSVTAHMEASSYHRGEKMKAKRSGNMELANAHGKAQQAHDEAASIVRKVDRGPYMPYTGDYSNDTEWAAHQAAKESAFAVYQDKYGPIAAHASHKAHEASKEAIAAHLGSALQKTDDPDRQSFPEDHYDMFRREAL